VAGSTWCRLLAVGSALLAAGAGVGQAQQQREVQDEVVQPEAAQTEAELEMPPLMPEGEDAPVAQDHEVEQLLTSLRRAQESLQLDHRPAAMQALIQAEEQLDEVAADTRDTEPWQRIELALQDAMKALGEDNPKYAQIALERVVGPAEDEGPGGDAAEGVEQPGTSRQTVSMDDVLGAEVVTARGETIADVSKVVRGRDDGRLYAILEVGGFLGIADKPVALPLDQLEIAEDDRLVLPQASESQLEDMPTYQADQYEQAR
jgi:hypothetical protein